MSSIQWERRAPLLCCHSCASDGELLVVAARALHRMIHIGPVALMKRIRINYSFIHVPGSPGGGSARSSL